MKHGTIANGGFYQMEVALFTKKSTLDSFERTTRELDEIRTVKGKTNKLLFDQILNNLETNKIKK